MWLETGEQTRLGSPFSPPKNLRRIISTDRDCSWSSLFPRRSPTGTGNVPRDAARSTRICDNPHDGGREPGKWSAFIYGLTTCVGMRAPLMSLVQEFPPPAVAPQLSSLLQLGCPQIKGTSIIRSNGVAEYLRVSMPLFDCVMNGGAARI